MNRLVLTFGTGALLTAASLSASSTDLIITGVFDGPLPGGDPKGVELYALADIPDLGLYAIGSASNGGGTNGPESGALSFSDPIAAGSFIYLTNGDGTDFSQWFGFAPTIASVPGSALNHNGDDAIELFFDASGAFSGGETVIDVFGEIDVDGTGQAWESLDGWAYRNNGVAANGGSFDASNWAFSGPNAWDGDDNILGGTDNGTNDTATPPFPIGSYSPDGGQIIPTPTTALLGFAGVGSLILARRRRR